MRNSFILARRELGSYFVNWTGYVVIALVLFLSGLGLVGIIESVNTEPITSSVTELFFESYYFWLILIAVVPLITMRIFAREISSGTIETLMTSPVKSSEIVAAKFLGALVFYILIWLPLFVCVLIAQYYTSGEVQTDYGKLLSVFLGII
ncbi:MAG: ABC transporter permease, partial [Verrucomicrobiia bacterium]